MGLGGLTRSGLGWGLLASSQAFFPACKWVVRFGLLILVMWVTFLLCPHSRLILCANRVRHSFCAVRH